MRVSQCAARGFMIALCIISTWGVAMGRQDDAVIRDPEALFSRAVKAYDLRHYREAADQFGQICSLYPRSVRVTAALIMRAKSLYALGDNIESAKSARTLLSDYSSSLYCADAHYVLGSIFHRIGRNDESLEEISRSYNALPKPVPPVPFNAPPAAEFLATA